ncbi:MAG: roadblock/LC7 domain-containing protein [Candidatus Thorarchaeota archaeon]
MNKIEPSDTIKSLKLEGILKEIRKEGNLKAVLFSNRDGQLIREELEGEIDSDLFSSMCASVLESAEGLANNLGDKRILKVIAELEKQSIIILKCDKKTFLTLILKNDSKINKILDNIENYIRKIIFLY